MSIAALRWLALPLGLLVFALRLARTFWLTPIIWDLESSATRFWALLAGDLLALGIPVTIYLLLARRFRHPPARFSTRDGRFTAPQNPTFAASQAILWMYISANGVLFERVPGGDSLRPSYEPASIILVGIAWAVALSFLLVQRPLLHLDREGLTLRRLRGTTRVAWDQLLPGSPTPPSKKDRSMRVYLRKAPVAGNWPGVEMPSLDIPHRYLYIDPGFLANALRHYAEFPEDRATIGTTDGHAVPVS